MAVRILSQTCDGASKYNLKRTLAEALLTEGRNHIEQERLRDLAFVHYKILSQMYSTTSQMRRLTPWMIG
nr:uncharacterized protein LOC109192333 isoform X1 [Ipomoea trifida]